MSKSEIQVVGALTSFGWLTRRMLLEITRLSSTELNDTLVELIKAGKIRASLSTEGRVIFCNVGGGGAR